jgi:hypothetical protein
LDKLPSGPEFLLANGQPYPDTVQSTSEAASHVMLSETQQVPIKPDFWQIMQNDWMHGVSEGVGGAGTINLLANLLKAKSLPLTVAWGLGAEIGNAFGIVKGVYDYQKAEHIYESDSQTMTRFAPLSEKESSILPTLTFK